MKTVKSSELGNLAMTAGNEEKYALIIQDGDLKEWVGIGWITLRSATDEDRLYYPTVKDK